MKSVLKVESLSLYDGMFCNSDIGVIFFRIGLYTIIPAAVIVVTMKIYKQHLEHGDLLRSTLFLASFLGALANLI
jgi:hypothetical protein